MRVALKHYEAWVSCTREFPMHIRTFLRPRTSFDGRRRTSTRCEKWRHSHREPNGRTRVQCDRVFLDFMEEMGVSRTRRQLMWLAVRIGGWLAVAAASRDAPCLTWPSLFAKGLVSLRVMEGFN
jgi:hypothetical protein